MKKGIGPRGLGAPKSAAKMYGKSPAKQATKKQTRTDVPLEGRQENYVKEPYKRQMGPLDQYNPNKPGTPESKKYAKDYQIQYYEGVRGKQKAGIKPPGVSSNKK